MDLSEGTQLSRMVDQRRGGSLELSFHPSLVGASSCWPETLAIAARSGFVAVDLTLPELASGSARSARERLETAGVRAGASPLPVEFRRDEEMFRDDLGRLPGLAKLASAIGVGTVYRSLPASSEVPAGELGRTLKRRLRACAEILAEYGIRLALEVVGPLHRRREGRHEFLWRLSDCASFAEMCGDSVGVLVDSWHWHHANEDENAIVELGDRILHVHLADAPDLPPEWIRDDERLLPGEGVIDLDGFVRSLARAGYGGLVSPEIPGGWCGSCQPAACAQRAKDACSRVLSTPPPPPPPSDRPRRFVRSRAADLVRLPNPATRSSSTPRVCSSTGHVASNYWTPSPATVSHRSGIAIRTGSRRSSGRPRGSSTLRLTLVSSLPI